MGTMTAEEQRTRRADARARGQADPSLIPHGTSSGYQYWGCRCGICVRGMKRRNADAYQRRARRMAGSTTAGAR